METKNNDSTQDVSECQISTNSESNLNCQLASKSNVISNKRKTPRYLRNASIKLLTHPVDKNIAWSFILSVIFAAISVLTGFPTVIMLTWFLGIALGLRIVFARCCAYRGASRAGDVENQRQFQSRQPSCLRAENFVRPPEALWLHDSSFNLHVAHCLFFLDSGFTCSKLRELLMTRILSKTTDRGGRAFPRFLQKVVPVCSGYCWIDDEDFSIENHVFEEKKEINSSDELEEHISNLMNQPLPSSRPLWEIRVIKDYGKSKDTVLVLRIHQAISDGITLVVILGNHLCDNQKLLRLKSRFGYNTFFLNLFRAFFVAPLTFLGWLIFKRRDYNYFNRHHKPQSRVVAWSHNIRFSKVLRIKQVMRCSLNDVFVSAVSGAVRAYFAKNGINNPPNVTVSLFLYST
nr:uncharacterized protein LOC122271409 [Parasteatoda tepidariorum]